MTVLMLNEAFETSDMNGFMLHLVLKAGMFLDSKFYSRFGSIQRIVASAASIQPSLLTGTASSPDSGIYLPAVCIDIHALTFRESPAADPPSIEDPSRCQCNILPGAEPGTGNCTSESEYRQPSHIITHCAFPLRFQS